MPAPTPVTRRIEAVDAQRGLIMLLMALDHAADFVSGHHTTEIWGVPVPQHPSGLAYLTRLVSHLCAPGFCLLMGMGMTLFAASRRERGWGEGRITRHFLVRGAVLVVADLLLASPAFLLASDFGSGGATLPPIPGAGGPIWAGFGVLTALGVAMMLGGLLVRTPAVVSAAVGLGVVLACQALVPGPASVDEPYSVLWRVLLIPGQTGGFLTIYSVLPWFGVSALGLAAGELLRRDAVRCLRWAPAAGVAALAGFGVVRAIGGFGNTSPATGAGWMSFLAVTKYPPSVTFLLLTLGANTLLLGLFAGVERWRSGLGRWARPLLVLGRAPLFFYVLHLWVYALIGLAIPGDTTLVAMYPVWLVGVALLLPACALYERFKGARPEESVWRLF